MEIQKFGNLLKLARLFLGRMWRGNVAVAGTAFAEAVVVAAVEKAVVEQTMETVAVARSVQIVGFEIRQDRCPDEHSGSFRLGFRLLAHPFAEQTV